MRKRFSALEISRKVIAERVKEGDTCIDATMGRGNDTAYLCSLTGGGRVIAFDIQPEAIESTKELLDSKGYTAELHLESHTMMDRYTGDNTAACVTFNLGWLPKGDHSIHTNADTSIEAISKAMRLIKPGGVISVIIYYGRDTGYEEKERVIEFLKNIDSDEYSVIIAEFANRPNDPPIPCFIFRE
ncbi:MAG: class I SAM-dependent methyltransferase [Oscillospiraceae bacterium]|nr:class I SAM-dependent methyltransferase [Oscillospiraceae bacterium]